MVPVTKHTPDISYNLSTLSLRPVSVKPNPQSLRAISLLPAPALHERSLTAQQHGIKASGASLRLGVEIGSIPNWNQYMLGYENYHKSEKLMLLGGLSPGFIS